MDNPTKRFAIFSPDGFPEAFYAEDIHGDSIPSEATLITEDQWLEFINNQGFRKWDGSKVVPFEPDHIEPLPRLVPKSVIVARLIEAGKIEEAHTALNNDPAAWARWVASDRPAINFNDPDAIALLTAIGADPDEILAP